MGSKKILMNGAHAAALEIQYDSTLVQTRATFMVGGGGWGLTCNQYSEIIINIGVAFLIHTRSILSDNVQAHTLNQTACPIIFS